jgi:hypothetical protein
MAAKIKSTKGLGAISDREYRLLKSSAEKIKPALSRTATPKGLGAISDSDYRRLQSAAAKVKPTPVQVIRTTVNMKSTPTTKKRK